MSEIEVKEQAQEVVLELLPGVSSEEIADDTDIFSLGLDSINAMTLVLNLQESFELQFDVNEISLENFQTLSSIVNLIQKKQSS